MSGRKDQEMLNLTKEDWIEIYYTVRDKYEVGQVVSTDRKWKDHLKKHTPENWP